MTTTKARSGHLECMASAAANRHAARLFAGQGMDGHARASRAAARDCIRSARDYRRCLTRAGHRLP